MSLTALYTDDVRLFYGDRTLLSGVTYQFAVSSITVLSGPNGIGKTSLLRALCGINTNYRGTISLESGKPPLFVSYQTSYLLDFTVWENILYYCGLYEISIIWSCKVAALLEQFGLFEKKNVKVKTLSTGQKKRLMLAIIELLRPEFLFWDEPTTGLDSDGCCIFLKTIKNLAVQNHSTVVIASHDVRLFEVCDQQLSLDQFLPKQTFRTQIELLD